MEKLRDTICDNCRVIISEFYDTEYYGINYKQYCSLQCFYDDDKKEEPTKEHKKMMDKVNEAKKFLNKIKARRQDSKVQDRSQTNKSNNRKNKVHKKKSKQKTKKRK